MVNKKKILITGSTGFLGSHFEVEYSKHHDVICLSRKKEEKNCHITADLKTDIPTLDIPDLNLVIHAAGKAHVVPATKEEEQDFFDVNAKGTENLLTALEKPNAKPQAFVFISTVAVYGRESGINIDENAPLLAEDPYGLSKKIAEDKVIAWGKEHKVKTTILRLPLIIGKNAPGNLGAMINAINKGFYFNIGNGTARRSMVMAGDVASIIFKASEIGGIYNLTDGVDPTYGEISEEIGKLLHKKVRSMPLPMARIFAKIGSTIENFTGKKLPFSSRVLNKMTNSLTFSSKKAQNLFHWQPEPVLENLNKII